MSQAKIEDKKDYKKEDKKEGNSTVVDPKQAKIKQKAVVKQIWKMGAEGFGHAEDPLPDCPKEEEKKDEKKEEKKEEEKKDDKPKETPLIKPKPKCKPPKEEGKGEEGKKEEGKKEEAKAALVQTAKAVNATVQNKKVEVPVANNGTNNTKPALVQ